MVKYVFIRVSTQGDSTATKKINVEVCGGEQVVFADPIFNTISLNFTKLEGPKNSLLYKADYINMVKSSSINCPIVG